MGWSVLFSVPAGEIFLVLKRVVLAEHLELLQNILPSPNDDQAGTVAKFRRNEFAFTRLVRALRYVAFYPARPRLPHG